MVGVAGEGDLESILQADQALHRIGRGRVHADLAVPIHRHETEGRIDGLVDDREVQPVALGDRPPVVDAGAAERIHAQADLRAANRVHVDHIAEIADVGIEIVVPVRRGGAKSLLERNPLHALQAVLEKLVGLRFDPAGDVASPPARRSAGLYLKPPSWGGLCEGVITMPSASPVLRPRL